MSSPSRGVDAAMKRASNLYPKVVLFDNLVAAAHEASRGKRSRPDVARLNLALEEHLVSLQTELMDRTYAPGPHRTLSGRGAQAQDDLGRAVS